MHQAEFRRPDRPDQMAAAALLVSMFAAATLLPAPAAAEEAAARDLTVEQTAVFSV